VPSDYPFVRDDVLPSFWANAIQEMISSLATGIRVEKKDATTVRVPAGTGDDQAGLTIDGLWRWTDATIERAHPGGTAGTYVLWATAADNDISSSPDPYTDNTDYSFALAITSGAAPGGVDASRALADLTWDGSAITAIAPRRGVEGPAGAFIFAIERTYTLAGPLQSQDTVTDPNWLLPFRVPILSGQKVELYAAWGELQGGGSANVDIMKRSWGSTSEAAIAAAWQGLVFGTIEKEYTPTAQTLTHRDRIRPRLVSTATSAIAGTTVAGTPVNLDLTLGFRMTIASS
jgi:hypothetical protein